MQSDWEVGCVRRCRTARQARPQVVAKLQLTSPTPSRSDALALAPVSVEREPGVALTSEGSIARRALRVMVGRSVSTRCAAAVKFKAVALAGEAHSLQAGSSVAGEGYACVAKTKLWLGRRERKTAARSCERTVSDRNNKIQDGFPIGTVTPQACSNAYPRGPCRRALTRRLRLVATAEHADGRRTEMDGRSLPAAIGLAPSCSLAGESGAEAGPPVYGGRDMSHGE
jgi:hypothetical protein